MFSATYDPKKPLTMTTGVLMVPEETMKAMHAELDRLRGRTMECPTCAERGYDNADYHRLHRAWCDSVAEIERLRAALEPFACISRDNPHWADDDTAYLDEMDGLTAGDFHRALKALSE
jgi:hypothetical protein